MAKTQYPTTDYIEKIVEKYIPPFNNSRNGLFLLPAQTGSGKTHAIAKVISKILRKHPDKLVHYIIASIENRDEMYKLLMENLKQEKGLQDEVIVIKSNIDSLIDFFSKNNKFNFEVIGLMSSFKEFEKKMKVYLAINKKNDFIKNDELKSILTQEETNLKNEIRKKYNQLIHNKEDTSKLESEVSLLYPTVNLTKRVVISTTKKFLVKSFDLPKSTTLYEKAVDKDTLIIIDEFDEQKRELLSHFVEEATKNNIENVDFIIKLYKHMTKRKMKKFPKNDYVDAFIEAVGEFYNKYNLDYSLYAESSDKKKYFLKESSSSIVRVNNQHFSMELDINKAKQFVVEQKEKVDKNENNFLTFYRETETFINRFITLAKSIAYEYQKIVKEDISFDDALRTFLTDIFGYNDYRTDIVVNRVYDVMMRGQGRRKILISGLAEAYENNYSAMHIVNDSKHNESSRFSNYQLFVTPESFLLKMIQNNFVVGISATALNETRLHNFDIQYLTENSSVIKPSAEELQTLEELYLEHKVKNREYQVSIINQINGKLSLYNDQFVNKINDLCANEQAIDWLQAYSDNAYDVKVIIQFVEVFKYFCTTEINAFLYLNTADLKNKLAYGNIMYMLIFAMIKQHYKHMPQKKKKYLNRFVNFNEEGVPKNFNESFEKVKNENSFIFFTNAKDGKKVYKKELEEHGVVFLVSNYKHMATGQNIQYQYNNIKYDFDGIFLGRVSNIISTNLKYQNENEQEINKTVLATLYDVNVLQQAGIISFRELTRFFNKFLAFNTATIPHKDTTEYYNSVMHKIIQSIGRLHRTDTACTLHLLFDNSNIDALRNYKYENKATLPAVKEAISTAKKLKVESDKKTTNIADVIIDKAHQNRRIINRILGIFNARTFNFIQYKNAIDAYTSVRKQLLSNPTSDLLYSSNPEYIDPQGHSIYYLTDDDFETIEISLEPKAGFHEVSKESARIDILEKIPEIYECFKEKNIDTKWDKQYIMNPVSFNNLYKGELGEIIGKFILEEYCGIDLLEIDAESMIRFEAFDFMNETQNIFVDFKYFSTNTAKNTEIGYGSDFIENIQRKVRLANIKDAKIFIINVMVDEENQGEFKDKIATVSDNIYIVPWLIKSHNRIGKLDKKMLFNLREEYNACKNK